MQPLPGGFLPPNPTGQDATFTEVNTFVALENLYTPSGNYLGHVVYEDNVWLAYYFDGSLERQIGTYQTQEEARAAVFQTQET